MSFRPSFLMLAAASLAVPALAQEIETDARAVVAAGLLDESRTGPSVGGEPLIDLSASIQRTDTFETGLQLIWRGAARAQRDAPGRTAFAGLPAGPPGGVLVSPSTGIGGAGDDEWVLAAETASLTVSGAWGELVGGLDAGAATRLDARAPQVLDGVSVLSPMLDPTGRSIVRARNDPTGSSLKASYFSPRWIGFRVGASFTPEANLKGVDFDSRPEVAAGGVRADLEEVWEGALSFDRRFRSVNTRVRAALTYSSGEPGRSGAGFQRYEAWGGGLEVERAGWIAGVRHLSSNNALGSGGRYQASEAGLSRTAGDWTLGVEAGWAKDSLQDLKGQSFLIGAKRTFGERWSLGGAVVWSDLDRPVLTGFSGSRGSGFVIEASVRK